MSVQASNEIIHSIKRQIGQTMFGLENTIDDLLIALLSEGHILLEDVPGVGKTALAKAFAHQLGLSFHRIQCTPDLLPADIVGGLVFHPKDGEFVLRKGPVFANILLVDEINRALPRTQSALLEAMAEGQVTIDGETHALPDPFLVIATQNPIESQGVFPLPEAQLDRFLLKTSLGYPPADVDIRLLQTHLSGHTSDQSPSADGIPTLNRSTEGGGLAALRQVVGKVVMDDDVLSYISHLVRATREHSEIEIGASPRAMILLAKAARSSAVLDGRNYVTPDDVQRVAKAVLFHRLVFQGHATSSELDGQTWIADLVRTVDVPIEANQ